MTIEQYMGVIAAATVVAIALVFWLEWFFRRE